MTYSALFSSLLLPTYTDHLLWVCPFGVLLIILRQLKRCAGDDPQDFSRKPPLYNQTWRNAAVKRSCCLICRCSSTTWQWGTGQEGEGGSTVTFCSQFLPPWSSPCLPYNMCQLCKLVINTGPPNCARAAVSPWCRCGSGFRMVNNQYAHCLSQIWIQMHRTSIL